MADNAAFQPREGQSYDNSVLSMAPQVFGAAVTLAGGANAGGAVPTVAAAGGAGTGAAVSAVYGYDQACSFTLTGGSASAGGSLASVTFGTPPSSAPVSVTVTAGETSGTTGVPVGAVSVTSTGFVVQGGSIASGTAVEIAYRVVGSPV